MQGHKTGQLGAHRHFSALAGLAVLDDNGTLSQAHVFDAQRREFRHPRAGLQQHLHHQSDLATRCISLVNEAQFFLKGQARRGAAVFLPGMQPGLGTRLLEDGLGLGVIESLAHQDVGDLLRDTAWNVEPQEREVHHQLSGTSGWTSE